MLLHAFTTIVPSVVVALAVTFGQALAAGPEDLNKLTPEQLKAGLERQHPAAYYVLAGKLFGQAGRTRRSSLSCSIWRPIRTCRRRGGVLRLVLRSNRQADQRVRFRGSHAARPLDGSTES